MYIYFVTPDYIKQNTIVGANVDAVDINPLIKTAADSWVRSYLGTWFYQDLLAKFNNQTLSGDEITLVQDYIKGCVCWRAAADSVLFQSYQLRNKGLQTQNGDFSASPEFRALALVLDKCKDKSDLYDQRLITYLVDNKQLFPVMTSALNTDSVIVNQYCSQSTNPFQSGIMII